MLHCFKCGADLPDNIVYCLQCGARLEDDEVQTVVVPQQVVPLDNLPVEAPEKRRGSGASKFILGGLIGAGIVIVVLGIVGILLFSRQGEQVKVNANTGRNAAISSTPTPTATPTPKKTTPTPSPTPSPSPTDENIDIPASRTCEIVNPAGGTVNLRRYCDERDCSLDSSTLYMLAQPGEAVETTKRRPVTTGSYTWVQVKYEGELVWISSARINCD